MITLLKMLFGCGFVKKLNKIALILMTILLIISSFSMFGIVVNASTEGSCGIYEDNVIWSFNEDDYILTISGTGKMKNYNYYQSFDGNCSNVKSIIITDGVTNIGTKAFAICEVVTNISIPKSVVEINDNAFENCSLLTYVYYEGTCEDWEKIDISLNGNNYLTDATIIYNYETHVCSFGDWITTFEPTCIDVGTEMRECDCGKKEFNNISPTGKHNYVWKITVEATCTDNGQETSYCSVCNKKGEIRSINELGHRYGDWKIDVEPTCVSEGSRVKKCETCGIVLEKEIIEQLPHNFGNWKTTIKETEEHNGEEIRTCKSCKYSETREIDNIHGSDEIIIIGDADSNGKVTAIDARLVLQVVAGIKTENDINCFNADINNDNKITAMDARKILQIVAGINSN